MVVLDRRTKRFNLIRVVSMNSKMKVLYGHLAKDVRALTCSECYQITERDTSILSTGSCVSTLKWCLFFFCLRSPGPVIA